MPLRLGGPVFEPYSGPEEWAAAVKRAGWAATTCPIPLDSSDDLAAQYRRVAEKENIQISEVGAWSSLISPSEEERKAAFEKSCLALDLAERLGAVCAVTISGSRSSLWDGPHPGNLTQDAFDLTVEITRAILDRVKPRSAFFTLETMPWALPDSPDSYLELVAAIDRPQFAVHLDPVNMISSARRALDSSAFLRECFTKLGPLVKNIHAKDFHLDARLTLHISEVLPGKGSLDYKVFLQEAAQLPGDVGFVVEHLSTAEEYQEAARHVRASAAEAGVALLPG